MPRWEYKILEINVSRYFGGSLQEHKLEHKLNELGDKGWELVNIFDMNIEEGKSSIVVANLKRELKD